MKVGDIARLNPQAVVLEPREYHDRAIVGLVETKHGLAVAYSKGKFIKTLVDQGMSEEEAWEWFDYNTMRALPYMASAGTPPVFSWNKKLYRRVTHGKR